MRATLFVLGAVVAAVGLMVADVPLAAHHSLAAQFDIKKPATVVGTITRMEWRSPHAWLYIDVKDERGEVSSWAIEFGAANALYRRGWRKEDLPVGATVTVAGYLARDGSKTLSATEVKLPDGRALFAGTAR
jgi:hypothetical protein